MKLRLTIVMIILLCGCESMVIQSEPVVADPAAMPKQIETEAADALPAITYDSVKQTLTIAGSQNYLSLDLPVEVQTARLLVVQDDGFELSIYLPVLRDLNRDIQARALISRPPIRTHSESPATVWYTVFSGSMDLCCWST